MQGASAPVLRSAGAALVLALHAGTALPAQSDATLLHHHPIVVQVANEFPVLGWRLHVQRRSDYDDRVTTAREVVLEAGFGFQGSRFARVTAWAPQLADGWRARARLEAERAARFGFFGLGNDTEKDDDLTAGDAGNYYRVRRVRYGGTIEVTRHLMGALHAAGALGILRAEYEPLPGPDLFDQTFPGGSEETDATGRLTLVYDTRDREYDTARRGLLLETGVLGGSGGGGYTRVHAVARGYLTVVPRVVTTVRVGGAGATEGVPLDARTSLAAWEDEATVLGGRRSFRGAEEPRWLGRGLGFAGAEARWAVWNEGDVGGVSLFGFVDAGRVFEEEAFELTLDDWHASGGGGVAARLWRRNVLTVTLGVGEDGVRGWVGGGWSW